MNDKYCSNFNCEWCRPARHAAVDAAIDKLFGPKPKPKFDSTNMATGSIRIEADGAVFEAPLKWSKNEIVITKGDGTQVKLVLEGWDMQSLYTAGKFTR